MTQPDYTNTRLLAFSNDESEDNRSKTGERRYSTSKLTNTTGKYFAGNIMISSSSESYDKVKAAELWETSAELVGLVQKKEVHKGLQKSTSQI